jgi:hypothetical protein
MTIDKFDPNPILVNINKLKPYRFVEDKTLQPALAKPNDFLLKGPVETNHFSNLFTKELVKLYTRGLTMYNPIKKKTNCSLSNQELVKEGTSDLLKKQLVEKVLVSLIFTQNIDVSINLVIRVSFLEKVCLKCHIVFYAPPLLIPWL